MRDANGMRPSTDDRHRGRQNLADPRCKRRFIAGIDDMAADAPECIELRADGRIQMRRGGQGDDFPPQFPVDELPALDARGGTAVPAGRSAGV